MYRNFQSQDTDEEMMSYVPNFDETALSTSSIKRIRRIEEHETANAMVRATRIVNHQKMAMVAILCQGQLEDAVTACMARNPRPHAAANLCTLAEANAEYLYRLIRDDYDPYWR